MHLLASIVVLSAVSGAQPPTANFITGVRHWTLGDITRIVVETTGDFEFRRDRVPNPDRLFFDLESTRPKLGQRGQATFRVNDPRLKQIRVAQTQPGTSRVVFDLEEGVDYTSSRLSNPPRLIVELKRNPALAAARTVDPAAKIAPPSLPGSERASVPPSATTSLPAARTTPSAELSRSGTERARLPGTTNQAPAPGTAIPLELSRTETSTNASAERHAPVIPAPSQSVASVPANTHPLAAAVERPNTAPSVMMPPPPPKEALPQPELTAAAPPLPRVTPKVPVTLPGQPRRTQQQLPPPPRAASLNGHSSMARVLGLKLGRIVLDAGHGGHDTGTIGPGGLLEKDLCLDIAERLGELIANRMGAEVIFTRTDDTFIPLERRPEIANERKADLFLSIHANSSPLASSSGVETYYLNFTTSKAAMEVAARENASSQKTMFELKDVIQRIALQDKVEESREFAAKVQQSLYTASLRANSRTKDRGVRKAPFVVLVGASMPAILAEIGFVSNPRDEALMKKPEFRQRIAEGLYQGLSKYAATLSHFEVAQK